MQRTHRLFLIVFLALLAAGLPACGNGSGEGAAAPPAAPVPLSEPPATDEDPAPEEEAPVLDTSFLTLGTPGTQEAAGEVEFREGVVHVDADDVLEELAGGSFVVDAALGVEVDDILVRWDSDRLGQVTATQNVVNEASQVIGTQVVLGHASLEDLVEQGAISWNVTPEYTAAAELPDGLQKAADESFFEEIDGGFRVLDVELFHLEVNSSGQIDWSESHFANKALSRFASPLLEGASLSGAAGGHVKATLDELLITIHPTLVGSADLPHRFDTRIDGVVKLKARVTIESSGEVAFELRKDLPSPAPIPLPAPIPVELDVDFTAGMRVAVDGAGSVTVGIDHEYALVHRAAYNRGEMTLWETESDFIQRDPTVESESEIDATARLYLDVRATLRFFKMIGPFFVLQPYIQGDIEAPLDENDPRLMVGLAGQAGLNLGPSFLNRDIFRPMDLFDIELASIDLGGDEAGAGNRAPIVEAPTIRVPKNRPYTITLPGVDPDGHSLRWRITSDPDHGWLGVLEGNRVEYTPRDAGVLDLIEFTVTDAFGESTEGAVWLQILDRHAPNADFDYEFVGTRLTLTPACSDVEDSWQHLEFRWDLHGDGTFDTDWQRDFSVSHRYGSLASQTVVLEVRDTDGMVSRVSRRLAPGDDSEGDFVAVSAGRFHSVALDKHGRVWTWGINGTTGRLGDSTPLLRTRPGRLNGLPTITQIAAGHHHTLLLDDRGRVWGFGNNNYGELGDGTGRDRATPQVVPYLPPIVKIAAGRHSSYAIDNVGDLWAWGENDDGELGLTASAPEEVHYVQVSPHVGDLVDIAAGNEHALAIDADGVVWAWGDNYSYALGNGGSWRATDVVRVSDVTGASMLAGADESSLALVNGRVYGWGYNGTGQTGYGDDYPKEIPYPHRTSISGVRIIAAGDNTSMAILNNGALVGWGQNREAELGIGTFSWEEHGVTYARAPRGFDAVSCGRSHTLALRNGHIWSFGTNFYGMLGTGDHANRSIPTRITD